MLADGHASLQHRTGFTTCIWRTVLNLGISHSLPQPSRATPVVAAMKSIIFLLPATVAALSAPLSRRNAITGSLAAAAVPGASNAAPSAAVIGYDDVVLDLPCGARVPACVWLPSDGTDAPPASYKYRISAGRLVKTILGLPTPDAIARTFRLDAPGVREAPGATVKDGTPVVVVAHGFSGDAISTCRSSGKRLQERAPWRSRRILTRH